MYFELLSMKFQKQNVIECRAEHRKCSQKEEEEEETQPVITDQPKVTQIVLIIDHTLYIITLFIQTIFVHSQSVSAKKKRNCNRIHIDIFRSSFIHPPSVRSSQFRQIFLLFFFCFYCCKFNVMLSTNRWMRILFGTQ